MPSERSDRQIATDMLSRLAGGGQLTIGVALELAKMLLHIAGGDGRGVFKVVHDSDRRPRSVTQSKIVEARASVRVNGAVTAEGYHPEFRLETGRQMIVLTSLHSQDRQSRVELDLLFYPSRLTEDERQELEQLRARVAELEGSE